MSAVLHAAVIGGGPAGLQAALTLGRMHVTTVLFDDARYRNARSARVHNVLGWDGATPLELRSAGRSELAAYPWVSVIEERVTAARRGERGLAFSTATAEWVVERVLIATGVRDALLPIKGLHDLWGDVVLPCPYCHGHEFAPGPIAVISDGGHADHVAALLRGVSVAVPVLAPADVTAVTRSSTGVAITLRNGDVVEAACVFVPPNPAPRSFIADDLGVLAGPDGIGIDALGRTNRSDVWAAGDVARRLDARIPAAIITALASGLIAATDIAASVATVRQPPRTPP